MCCGSYWHWTISWNSLYSLVLYQSWPPPSLIALPSFRRSLLWKFSDSCSEQIQWQWISFHNLDPELTRSRNSCTKFNHSWVTFCKSNIILVHVLWVGPTLRNAWLFGNFAQKMAKDQQLILTLLYIPASRISPKIHTLIQSWSQGWQVSLHIIAGEVNVHPLSM